jgi:uncharacterized protein (DUF927 family)
VTAEGNTRNPTGDNVATATSAIKWGNGNFSMRDGGLYFSERKDSGVEQTRLCSLFIVVVHTGDGNGRAWGKLLRWRDRKNRIHQWAMPLATLQSDSTAELRRELADGDLVIAQGKTQWQRFVDYLALTNPARYARCVNRLGWQGDVFLLPDGVVGEANEMVVYQSEAAINPPMSVCGEVADWRASVGQLARGNSRVMFAVAAALAGTLLEPAGVDGGGFHFVGNSSTGKTTVLIAACSVLGNPIDYIIT